MTHTNRLTALLFMLAICAPQQQATAQITWTPYAGNPLIVGATFDAAATSVYGPVVKQTSSGYHLWYTRKIGTNVENIGYATSANGLNWALANPTVLAPSTDANRFDFKKVGQPSIIKDGDTLKMWYWGANTSQYIGYAWSMDGQNWTKVDGPGTQKSVYDLNMDNSSAIGLVTPNVIKDGATYKMWYSRLYITGGIKFRIGYATSPDGIHWTNVPGTGSNGAVIDLTTGSFDENAAYFPSVTKTGTQYEMWYAGSDDAALTNGWRIGYATSTNGVNWTKIPGTQAKNSVMDNSIAPSVTRDGGSYRMWYDGQQGISYAESGLTGMPENKPGSFRIYPNPGSGQLQVAGTDNIRMIEIRNVVGKLVYSWAGTSENISSGLPATIDLTSQPTGVYLYRAYQSNGSYSTGKLVLN